VNSNRCTTNANAFSQLRNIVKEIASYMTAVLIQGFLHSMIGECSLVVVEQLFIDAQS
jgi:hypothetical protein